MAVQGIWVKSAGIGAGVNVSRALGAGLMASEGVALATQSTGKGKLGNNPHRKQQQQKNHTTSRPRYAFSKIFDFAQENKSFVTE